MHVKEKWQHQGCQWHIIPILFLFFFFHRKWHTKKSLNLAGYFFLFRSHIALGRPSNCFVHATRIHCHLCSLFLLLHHYHHHPQLCLALFLLLLPFSSPPPWILATRSRKARGERSPKQSRPARAVGEREQQQQSRERKEQQKEREHTQTRSLALLSLSSTTPFSLTCAQAFRSLPLSSSLPPLPPHPCPSSQLFLPLYPLPSKYYSYNYNYKATSSRPLVLTNPISCILVAKVAGRVAAAALPAVEILSVSGCSLCSRWWLVAGLVIPPPENSNLGAARGGRPAGWALSVANLVGDLRIPRAEAPLLVRIGSWLDSRFPTARITAYGGGGGGGDRSLLLSAACIAGATMRQWRRRAPRRAR